MAVTTPMRDCLVYLAGPITAKGRFSMEQNIAAAVDVYLALLRDGVPCFCPHLSGLVPSHPTVPYETYLAYDLAILARCTHLLLLPRWQDSNGAVNEYLYAQGLPGIQISRSLEELFLTLPVRPTAPIALPDQHIEPSHTSDR